MESIVKTLFLELFEVNHIMLDLMDYVEDNYGTEALDKFCKDSIVNNYTSLGILKHNEECSYSCLGKLNEKELINFLNELGY